MSTRSAKEFSPQTLAANLNTLLPAAFSGKLTVAFSGGIDSAVLLYALARLREQYPHWQLRAIHIDHQLQSGAAAWAEHCRRIAEHLLVPVEIHRVDVNRSHAQGLEAAARDARYLALSTALAPNEVLLTAHHADDQVETLLLALMRGAGLRGLAAMPACAHFAEGWHIRPLLSFTRAQLAQWANTQGIPSLEDPSNENRRHDRNYLRHTILPVLRERWPSMATTVGRSTRHIGAAVTWLDAEAQVDLVGCSVARCLDVEKLKLLSDVRRHNLLRYWVRVRGFEAPSTSQLLTLDRDMLQAADDRNPCVAWLGVEVRRYRGLLYVSAFLSPPATAPREWNRSQPLEWSSGTLRIDPQQGERQVGLSLARLPEHLTVRARSEGEEIQLPHHHHHRTLKNLLQELGVLPWWRDQVPIVTVGSGSNEQIVAIGDLFIAQDFAATKDEDAAQLIWDNRPEIFSLR
ncbi:MAG: tRNA lysidine(34) synthetase TilS [Candidatus Obscuribacterales bacterium]|nr:tRNA lysidine(34) synthetase TilS [Steroidobacteraceae bacterium]